MIVKNKPLAEVSQRAIEILCRELGAVDTVRFINQFTTGHGDYTMERDALFLQVIQCRQQRHIGFAGGFVNPFLAVRPATR